jgi:hypothetical protein
MFLGFEDVKNAERMLSHMVNDHLVIRSDGLSQQTRSRVAMKGKFVSIYTTEIRRPSISSKSQHPSFFLSTLGYIELRLVFQCNCL